VFVSNGALVKTPIIPGSSSWWPSVPPMSSSLWQPAYSSLFRSQLWVYVVVMKRARALARLPIPVYVRGSDGGRSRDRVHPMARLLSNPNPGMSGFKLLEWTSATRDIFGRATWYKERRGGDVVNLWPLHPTGLTANGDGTWTFRNGNLELAGIVPTDLVHFLSFDPDRVGSGMSPLEPLRSTLENEFASRAATSSFWKRGARPGFVVEHPNTIGEKAYARLQASFAANHEGPTNVGSTLILEEGMKAAKMELTAEEAQYIETRKLNREEVCAVYDVPPPVVHILDRATFSNITEQMRSMYRDTMAPIAAEFEGVIDTELRAVEWPTDDVYAEFLMDDVMRGDFETRQDALNKASHMTIAEKRKVENLPFIVGTDRIFLNTATMPLDAIDAQSAGGASRQLSAAEISQKVYLAVATGMLSVTEARELIRAAGADIDPAAIPAKGLAQSDARTVLGRLGWQKSIDQVDPAALMRGLSPSAAVLVAETLAAATDVSGLKNALRAATKEDQ
jgi:HK97 family phage portal protein